MQQQSHGKIENKQLEQLLSLLTRINSELELNAILATIMESTKDIMQAEASSLMLVDKETGELIFAVPTGPASVDLSGKRIPSGKGIGGWVAENNEAAIVNEVKSDHRFLGDTDNFVTNNLACVPMNNAKGEVIGVLQAINKKDGNFEQTELILFKALADQAAITIEKAKYQEEALEKQRMEQEISLAQTIQEGLFPKKIPTFNGLDIAGKSLPAREVGGDYFDVIELSNGRALVILADISGKGVGASLVMVELRAIIRLLAHTDIEFVDLMQKVNNTIVEDTPSNTFLTLFIGIVDPNTATITYCNAGHNSPWLVQNNEVIELDKGGPIIGFMKNMPYEIATVSVHPGHKLLIYTDGFSEGERADGEQLGEEELLELFKHAKGNAKQQLSYLYEKLEEFVAGAEPSDDRTAMVVLCASNG
ncbi:GAF domain-containing protein [bacterium]|nr:MAG: GAF domain-containing protein [bacterium]